MSGYWAAFSGGHIGIKTGIAFCAIIGCNKQIDAGRSLRGAWRSGAVFHGTIPILAPTQFVIRP